MSTASPIPFVQLLLATSAERDTETAARVLRRISAALPSGTLDAALRRAVALPDAFVALIAEHGGDGQAAALAKNLCLTPDQLMTLVAAGGGPVVRAAFSPPREEVAGGMWTPRGIETAAEEMPPTPSEEAVRAADEAPGAIDPSAAVAVLRDPDCPPGRALGLLRAHPALAHTARVPTADPALPWSSIRTQRLSALPGRLDEPWESVTALEGEAAIALGRGAVTPEDLWTRVRPALVAVQAVSRLLRSRAPGFPDRDAADALARPLLARTVGADPRAWAELAARLAGAETTLPQLLDDIAEELRADGDGGGDAVAAPRIEPSAKVRPALLFLIRRLPVDDIRVLLPYFDARTTEELIQGNVPIPDDLLELAHGAGNRVLLGKIAAHQHLRDEEARRVRAYDDIELDRRLAWNRSGVTAALRREILAGVRPGSKPRRGVDEVLRGWVAEEPDHLEPKTLVLCGDPVLVRLGLAQRPRLRRIDLVDAVLSLWDRVGPDEVAGVIAAEPEAFSASVRTVVDAALAAGSTQGLVAARARWDRGGKKKESDASDTPVAEWAVEPARRLREYELAQASDGWFRSLPAGDIVRWGHPAAQALDALPTLCADGRGEEVRAALDAQVCAVMRGDGEEDAWAVFVQLVPEFAGTLPELAEVCAAAAYRPEGAA